MKLGQHFMVEDRFLEKIIGYASLSAEDEVLEIGAGEGALTERLFSRCKVIAVETDKGLAERLKERFKGIELIAGDVLKIELPEFNKCVSNIPYGISRDIVKLLMEQDFEVVVMTVQEEFAQKLQADPGSANYNAMSVLVQAQCDVELLDKVPRSAFKPHPRVDSRIVRLVRKKKPIPGLFRKLSEAFQERNKKASKVLGIKTEKRVSQLSPDEFPI